MGQFSSEVGHHGDVVARIAEGAMPSGMLEVLATGVVRSIMDTVWPEILRGESEDKGGIKRFD